MNQTPTNNVGLMNQAPTILFYLYKCGFDKSNSHDKTGLDKSSPYIQCDLMNQAPAILFPEKKTFPTIGKIPGDIIQDHKDK
jgi:hypothetical protein